MLNLIQTEFLKLRRKKLVWLMLVAAFIMPFFALLYFHYFGKTGIEAVMFYKWSAFGYTVFIILPFILGMLCTMLMHDENRHDVLKQLWIVPVSKMRYFFSKFVVIFIYSLCFMLITAIASVLFSVIPGYVTFEWSNVFFLLEKCLEIAVFMAFSTLPLLAISASQKDYVLPVCVTLIYIFTGFLITPINSYIHPLSCTSVILARNGDIPGATFSQVSVPAALFSICIWSICAVALAKISLSKRK